MTPRRAAVAALVLARVTLPLAVLAAGTTALPGLAGYEYDPLAGDAYAYYYAAREIIASLALGAAGVATLALGVLGASLAIVVAWRRGRLPTEWAVVAAVLLVLAVLAVPVARSDPTGAGAIGWPLVWSLALLPYCALGFTPDRGRLGRLDAAERAPLPACGRGDLAADRARLRRQGVLPGGRKRPERRLGPRRHLLALVRAGLVRRLARPARERSPCCCRSP